MRICCDHPVVRLWSIHTTLADVLTVLFGAGGVFAVFGDAGCLFIDF